MKLFRRKREQRSYTDFAMQLRAESLSGSHGIADLSATVQSAVSLWECGLSLAKASTPLLTPSMMALTARSLALTGEAVWVLADPLIPVAGFTATTTDGHPTAYRVTIPDTSGGRSMTVLAAEVLHFRIGCKPATPWQGTAPLHRASLSAGLLHAVESALGEVFENAPIGSLIVPMPESTTDNTGRMEASFRGKRGRVLLPESVAVASAGGATPSRDWLPSSLTPELDKSMAVQTFAAARASILAVFGVLPALLETSTTGPLVREAQRHLAQWTLTPIANLIAAEVSAKLMQPVTLDVATPLHAFDAGGRARSLAALVKALATAKEGNVTPEQVANAAKFAGVAL